MGLIPNKLVGNYPVAKSNASITFLKKLTSNANTSSVSNLYNTDKNTVAVQRVVNFNVKNMSYRHARNHADILKLLNVLIKRTDKNKILSVPKIISVKETNKQLTITREYIDGDVIDEQAPELMNKALVKCITTLRLLSKKLTNSELLDIPSRGKIYTIAFFPVYCFKLIISDPIFILSNLDLISLFYLCYLSTPGTILLTISHRDLSPNNILVNNNRIFLIDFETTLLSEPETDIAIATMYFSKKMKLKIMTFLQQFVKTNYQRDDYIRLSIFYIFQLLSNESKKSNYYEDTVKHGLFLKEKIIPELNSWQLPD